VKPGDRVHGGAVKAEKPPVRPALKSKRKRDTIMAADTANQKVFVPLQGVLKVQDYVRGLEQRIADSKHDVQSLKLNHQGAKFVIEKLGLPIEVRNL
jgi:hypothetical protein